MSDNEPNPSIRGIVCDVSANRSVFVGVKEGSDALYIRYINGDSITRLSLSREAAEATAALLSKFLDHTPDDLADYTLSEPQKSEWRLVYTPKLFPDV